MPFQSWEALLNSPANVSPGAALASSAALTDISPAPQLVIPANYLYAGQRIRIKAKGVFSNTATPTLLLGAYFGGVAGVALAATGAITTTTGASNWLWMLEYEGIVRSTGTAGSIWGAGFVTLDTALTGLVEVPIPQAAVQTAVTIDTTTAKAITIGAQWGTSSASNTITLQDLGIEALN